MAKSLRSKVKRDFRSKKREAGVYAAAEAARLHRLNAKLGAVVSKDKDGDEALEDNITDAAGVPAAGPPDVTNNSADYMQVDNSTRLEHSLSKPISTHGPRGSRREEWRLSKGLPAQPSRNGMNRQGGVAARRKAGRSKRRR
ncbi:hypothetical protein C8J55DRAFT_501803 [Lentinula edodes]|uniref:DUF2423 domain-containing protein n=1 Tax=Lentinula lateritia TaxID=40482 RepID=A0A9W9AXV1_9AGAR|nr:hypothetical protein C8J55DRAFT_501803 [Lentinula edodes]